MRSFGPKLCCTRIDKVEVLVATRPVFVSQNEGARLVSEVPVDFTWNAGMAASQKRKNVFALHSAAKSRGLSDLLEISSKSENEIGRRLSAFNLKLLVEDNQVFLECVYQGSKVFKQGGPYTDLFQMQPGDAKSDPRLRNSGPIVGFEFLGVRYPLSPKNAFYDWLYIRSLFEHRHWISKNVHYKGYTDIEFNPEKSVNCQARAFAELMALSNRGQLESVGNDFASFSRMLSPV